MRRTAPVHIALGHFDAAKTCKIQCADKPLRPKGASERQFALSRPLRLAALGPATHLKRRANRQNTRSELKLSFASSDIRTLCKRYASDARQYNPSGCSQVGGGPSNLRRTNRIGQCTPWSNLCSAAPARNSGRGVRPCVSRTGNLRIAALSDPSVSRFVSRPTHVMVSEIQSA
jgi:hypothetical protein